MSDTPSSPSHSNTNTPAAQVTSLSHEERAQRELDDMMSSLDPPRNSPAAADGDEDTSEEPEGPILPLTPLLTSASALRNALVMARRKSIQAKLHPYQRDVVDGFVKVTTLQNFMSKLYLLCLFRVFPWSGT